MVGDTNIANTYRLTVREDTELGKWLLNECEGPWSMGLERPIRMRQPYVSFARVADAVIFRLKQS